MVPLARVRSVTLVAVLALAVLNVADVLTTRLILAHGAVEADPLSALLLQGGALLWAKVLILAALFVAVLTRRPRVGVMALACGAAGMYATAVVSNLLILRMVA